MANGRGQEAIRRGMSLSVLQTIATKAAAEINLEIRGFCGKGAFKETFKAKAADGTLVALKIVDRAKIHQVRTDREIDALRRCNTPRIARLVGRHNYKAACGTIYDVVIEEFLDGGSLEDRIRDHAFTQTQVMELVYGLVTAVKELHLLHLVHRDIKPANIMFRIGHTEPVLVDFGLVRDLAQTSLTLSWLPHGPGTPFYAPPEQLNNDKSLIDWRADQFAIGVLAGALLTGKHPYQAISMSPTEAIYAVAERRSLAPEFLNDMNNRGLNVLVRMVRPWPVQRFSCPDALLLELEA